MPGLRGVSGFSETFVGFFYKLSFFHFSVGLVASVFFLVRTWIRAKSAVIRQQMKWVIWGSFWPSLLLPFFTPLAFCSGRKLIPG